MQENLPRLLSLEEEAGKIVAELQILSFMDFSAEKDLKEMQSYFNTYWVYYNAANVYLSSGGPVSKGNLSLPFLYMVS